MNSCWRQEDTKSTLIGLGGPPCSSPRMGYCNNYGYNLYQMGELYAELPIKLFYTPNHAEEVGHELIRVEPIEPKGIHQERAKRKPNRTIYCGLRKKQK